ncbi:MAG: flagellar hook-basal body complex protein FliE [Anaerolineae bacterium]|nr:flagellar hook-basal body complex protein FliE [Anaerolineae bacterium]MDW8099723.1 flagellar hook-basal body complex protein FliE [Anaerolineae bacterium]
MAIDLISQIQQSLPSSAERTANSMLRSSAGPSFGALIRDALEELNRLQVEANQAATDLVAGKPVDLHDVMIAIEKANLGFQLALQVRNKLVEAYQEIMRMQV